MKFLIQKENLTAETGTVIEAIDERNWFLNGRDLIETQYLSLHELKGASIDSYKSFIPVGSIDFAEAFLGRTITPLLIPDKLTKYAGRKLSYAENKQELLNLFDVWDENELFIKSASVLKCNYTDIWNKKDVSHLPDDRYFVSEAIEEIVSEWRVFVYKGQVQDIRCYSGDFWTPPDKNTVLSMIEDYTDCPPAYTLDVAVISEKDTLKTTVIEVHNFISCGLYGFQQKEILPMLKIAFEWEAQR